MMPVTAFLATGALFLAAVLGVPLVSLLAGVAAGLLLAMRSLPLAIAASAAALLAEYLAIRLAPARDPVIAQAGALVVLGRILGAPAGIGAWMVTAGQGLDAGIALRDLEARGVRALGVLAALALFAAGS